MFKKTAVFLLVCLLLIIFSCGSSSRADLELLESGKNLFFQDNYQKALIDFTKSAHANPRNDVSYAYMGFCYYYLKQTTPALSNFNKSLNLNPSNNIALFGKSLLIWDMGDYSTAYVLFDSVCNINPHHDKVFYYKAQANLKFHDTLQAIQNLKQAIRNAADFSPPYYSLASIYLKENKVESADSLLKLVNKENKHFKETKKAL